LSGLAGTFAATVSSEEVPRGKPAPDVYLEAARRLGVEPARSVAIEDSSNGLRSAAAAGMTTIAVPNEHYPPSSDALALAATTIATLRELTPALVAGLPVSRSIGMSRFVFDIPEAALQPPRLDFECALSRIVTAWSPRS